MKISTNQAIQRLQDQALPTAAELEAAVAESTPWMGAASDSGRTTVQTFQATRRPLRSRRWVLATAAAATAAVVAGGMLGPSLFGSSPAAATPALLLYTPLQKNPRAGQLFEELAERAAQQPPLPGSGRYTYVQTRTWALESDALTTGEVFDSRIAETQREQWMAADGSGRIEAIRDGQRTRYSGEFEGVRPKSFLTTSDPAALAASLLATHPDFDAGEWLNFVSTTWVNQAVDPAVQSALLTVLSRQNVDVSGQTTDRAGRIGLAFTAPARIDDGPLANYTLIINSETGMLLDFERVALEKWSDITFEVPATTEYVIWLQGGYTNSTQERP